MKENREELNSLIAQVKEVLYAKDEEIKKAGDHVISYIITEFKKLQIEGSSFIKRAETDLSTDSVVILQYKSAGQDLMIAINKIVL